MAEWKGWRTTAYTGHGANFVYFPADTSAAAEQATTKYSHYLLQYHVVFLHQVPSNQEIKYKVKQLLNFDEF